MGSEMCIRDRLGKDKVSSTQHESFHTSTTPTTQRRKWWSPWSILPRTVWKPQRHSLLAKPQAGVHRAIATPLPGEDKMSSPDQKCFHTFKTPTNRGRNIAPPGRYRLSLCGNPNLGFVKPAPAEGDKNPFPDQRSFHTSTTWTNRGRKWWFPGSIPTPMVCNSQPDIRRASITRGR